MLDKIKKIGEKEIYKGSRVHLFQEQIALPDGKEATWELIRHVGAAAVIPVDAEGKIIMVEQYRNATDNVTLEIPAGVLDSKDEDPLDCAKRELEEETGYHTDQFEFLFKFYSCIGICDEVIHVYVARNLKKSQQNLDEDEFVNVKHYSIDELLRMSFSGELVDNKTISSILAYQYKFQIGS